MTLETHSSTDLPDTSLETNDSLSNAELAEEIVNNVRNYIWDEDGHWVREHDRTYSDGRVTHVHEYYKPTGINRDEV